MDGLLLIINRDFLSSLEKRGLRISNLKIRYNIREENYRGSKFKPFRTLQAYNEFHSSILNSPNPLCSAGDFPIIENIELNNNNLLFINTYRWYNITENRFCVESIKYDSFRKTIQENEVIRYKSLMNEIFDKYKSDISKAISERLNSYVDPCYVDAGYVSPNA